MKKSKPSTSSDAGETTPCTVLSASNTTREKMEGRASWKWKHSKQLGVRLGLDRKDYPADSRLWHADLWFLTFLEKPSWAEVGWTVAVNR